MIKRDQQEVLVSACHIGGRFGVGFGSGLADLLIVVDKPTDQSTMRCMQQSCVEQVIATSD